MFSRSKKIFQVDLFKKRIAEVRELERKPGEMFWLIFGYGWNGWKSVVDGSLALA